MMVFPTKFKTNIAVRHSKSLEDREIPFGNGQLFALTAPDLRIPGIPDGVLQQVISQASTANV